MKYLLNNELAPLTFCWAFLNADRETVVAAVKQWREGYGRKLVLTSARGSLKELLAHLNPLTVPRNRELFVTINSSWTAYFDNAIDAGDVAAPTSYLTEKMKIQGVSLTCAPNTYRQTKQAASGVFGGVMMQVYLPEANGGYNGTNSLRTISAINDGGRWCFGDYGAVQAWERPECYNAKRKPDRFPPELLEEYCRHFGLDIFNPEFYGKEATLITCDEPICGSQEINKWQKENGFDS